MDDPTDTEPHATRLARWFQASPAELLGLAVLVVGALAVTGLLWFQANQRPDDLPNEAGRIGSAVDGDAGVDGPAPGSDGGAGPSGAHDGAGDDERGTGASDAGEAVADAYGSGPGRGHDGHDGGHDGGHDDGHGASPGSDGPDAPSTAPSTRPVDLEVAVHVTGAVERPGLVVLPDGGRVADAVDAAGGLTGDARTELINLARTLADGEHVHVPLEGEDPPVAVPPPSGPASDLAAPPGDGGADAAAGGDGAPEPGAPIDLNRASLAELETLPGIGPARAQAIVAYREEHGPFATVGDIRGVSGIGEAIFQGLADLVTAG